MVAKEILDKYKDQITTEQYRQNLSIIGNFAIEGMDLNEENIKDLIRMDNGETANALIAEKLAQWGIKR